LRGNELATDADGVQFSRKLADPAPYEFGLYLSAALEEQQRYGLRLAYASRLLLLARPGTSDIVSTAQYSSGSLLAAWQPSGRIRLALNGTLSRGSQQITPTAQLTAPGTTPTPGAEQAPIQVAPVVAVTAYRAETAGATADVGLDRAISVGGGAAYSSSGAAEEAGRTFFPPQDTWSLEAHGTAGLSPHDTLTLRAAYSRTDIHSFGVGGIVNAGLRWDRDLAPDVVTFAGAGVAATAHSSLRRAPVAGVQAPATQRVAPAFELGVVKRLPQERPGFGANLTIAYTPYVDPYTISVQKRGTVTGGMSWQPLARLRFSGQLSSAALIRDWRPRNAAAALDLGAWYLERRGDFGLLLRGGYTEVPRTDALPATADAPGRPAIPGLTYWEWGISFAVRWGWRTEI
jgi:hypothetical protein